MAQRESDSAGINSGAVVAVAAIGAACALAVINPPWRFEEAMREALPWIAERLGDGVTAAVSAPPASAPAPAPSA